MGGLTFDGCNAGANAFIERMFFDCVYDVRDAVGFALGLASVGVWVVAQVPQFISNYRNQSSEALSVWFVTQWFAGDTLNLLGCLVQGQQLPTTTILAGYFVLSDVFMLLQFIYYGALQARRERALRGRRKKHHRHHHLVQQAGGGGHGDSSGEDVAAGGGRDSPALPQRGSTGSTGGRRTPVYNDTHSGIGGSLVGAAPRSGLSAVGAAATVLAATSSVAGCLVALPALNRAGAAAAAGGAQPTPGAPHASIAHVARRLLLLATPAASISAASPPSGGGSSSSSSSSSGSSHHWHAGAAALHALQFTACHYINCDWAIVAGTTMGYLSTLCYLASRVSQIAKNLHRGDTEGLSVLMFMCTILANLCTGVSIIVRLESPTQLKEQLPWLCGTFGTVLLDVTLLYQGFTLNKHTGHVGIPASAAAPPSPQRHHHHHHHAHGQGQGQQQANGLGHQKLDGGGVVLAEAEVPLLQHGADGNGSV